jgi:hypothetical protein
MVNVLVQTQKFNVEQAKIGIQDVGGGGGGGASPFENYNKNLKDFIRF